MQESRDRQIEIDAVIDWRGSPDPSELRIQLYEKDLRTWLLELELLYSDLSDSLEVRPTRQGKPVRIVPVEKTAKLSELDLQAEEQQDVPIPKNYIGAAVHYFLEYYRDRKAPTDHIHLEVAKSFEVTLLAPDAKQGLSSEEAWDVLTGDGEP